MTADDVTMVDAAELARRQLVRRAVPAQRDEDVEVAVAETLLGEDRRAARRSARRRAGAADRSGRSVTRRGRAARAPTARGSRPHDPAPSLHYIFPGRYISFHGNYTWRAALLTAFAPAAWGTTYLVTERLLPPDRPLLSATLRALPTGLVLLAVDPPPPVAATGGGAPLLLGVCNIGLFFPLLFLAAYRLPGGLASTLQATSPLAVMALAALVIGERAGRPARGRRASASSASALLVLRSPGHLDTLGLVGAFGSVVVSALGFVLIKRWTPPVDMLTLVSWQLVVGRPGAAAGRPARRGRRRRTSTPPPSAATCG